MRRADRSLSVLIFAACLCACSSPEDRSEDTGPDGRPAHIVLIGIDTLRSDFLSAYGFPHASTPEIDRLGSEGAIFTDVVATSPWTLPTFASIMTGQYPSAHGAGRRTGAQRVGGEPPKVGLRSSVPLLQEILRQEAGYQTAVFYNNPYLGPQWGLTRGFGTVSRTSEGGAQAVTEALAWMKGHQEDPTFLFLHFMEPHLPYEPPEPYKTTAARWFGLDAEDGGPSKQTGAQRGDKIRALYAGEVRYVDQLVGSFAEGLRELRLLDETLLIVTSDHGEEFYEHADVERELYNDPREIWGIGHGHSQFQELLSVPLIIRFPPRVEAGLRIDSLVQVHDLAPSILEWAGLPPPEPMSGVSLVPTVERGESARGHAFSEFILYGDDRSSYREEGWKVILGPNQETSELYHLEEDPGETRNLRIARPRIFRSLARKLVALRSEAEAVSRAQPGEAAAVEIDAEMRKELRALGYID